MRGLCNLLLVLLSLATVLLTAVLWPAGRIASEVTDAVVSVFPSLSPWLPTIRGCPDRVALIAVGAIAIVLALRPAPRRRLAAGESAFDPTAASEGSGTAASRASTEITHVDQQVAARVGTTSVPDNSGDQPASESLSDPSAPASLLGCRACGRSVASGARVCPQCGATDPSGVLAREAANADRRALGCFITLLVTGILGYLVYATATSSDSRSNPRLVEVRQGYERAFVTLLGNLYDDSVIAAKSGTTMEGTKRDLVTRFGALLTHVPNAELVDDFTNKVMVVAFVVVGAAHKVASSGRDAAEMREQVVLTAAKALAVSLTEGR